jgi:hypothetical protein
MRTDCESLSAGHFGDPSLRGHYLSRLIFTSRSAGTHLTGSLCFIGETEETFLASMTFRTEKETPLFRYHYWIYDKADRS